MNPMDILKNVQQLQARMNDAQAKVREISAVGSAGGDMVRVELTGEFSVTKVTISPEAVDPNDISMLEDLVLAAFSDAAYKVRERIQQEMSSVTGGLNLPPGLFGQG
ncbi:MAG: YbaB/EbfC family nucleoid-associated protein [Spirochaetota bacterium]